MKTREHAYLNLETLESRVTPAAVISRFAANLDGWGTIRDDGVGRGSTPAIWNATGGRPGGYVSAVDVQDGHAWFWLAPAKYRGDHSEKYGSYLTFDVRQNTTLNPRNDNDVFLKGNGLTLAVNFRRNPDLDWTPYAVGLTEAGGWQVVGANRAPTADEFRSVLAGVTEMRICGEFSLRAATGSLDNVVFGGAPPKVTINSAQVNEGNVGNFTLRLLATLDHITAAPVTVSFRTNGGTATAGTDYIAVETSQVVFNVGARVKFINITVRGDRARESHETFGVTLFSPVNASLGAARTGIGTILNDD